MLSVIHISYLNHTCNNVSRSCLFDDLKRFLSQVIYRNYWFMQKLPCIIIDDCQADREYLCSLIKQENSLELKGSFSDTNEANTFIQEQKPVLVFMDIDMPVIPGMDCFKTISPQATCIFVTAYNRLVCNNCELRAFDLLLKPLKPGTFENCINRLKKEYLKSSWKSDRYKPDIDKNIIMIKEGTTKHRIDIGDILYIEAIRDYSKVVTSNKKIMTLLKLKNLMQKLPEESFVRIHKSYAIAVAKVSKLNGNSVYIRDSELPIGKTFKKQLKTLF